MILQNAKFHNLIPPGVIKDNAAFTSYVLDKQTFDNALGVLVIFLLGATDKAMAVLKIQQADAKSSDTALTSAEDVHDFTTKPSATDDNGMYGVYISMGAWTKRYLNAAATAGNGTNGTYLAAIAIADMNGQGAALAASLGLTVLETELN